MRKRKISPLIYIVNWLTTCVSLLNIRDIIDIMADRQAEINKADIQTDRNKKTKKTETERHTEKSLTCFVSPPNSKKDKETDRRQRDR
jgi:hypothetical protein